MSETREDMSETKHSPEPLHRGEEHENMVQIHAADSTLICRLVGGKLSTPSWKQMQANADRLVAAWNACAGISTDELDRLGVAGLLKALNELAVIDASRSAPRPREAQAMTARSTRDWRRIGRRDKAEPDVVLAFLRGGATVERLPGGKGRPDLLVGYLGRTALVEVKTDRAALSAAQEQWAKTWAGERPVVARTPAQARKWLKVWAERSERTRITFPRQGLIDAEHAVYVPRAGGGPDAAVEDSEAAEAEAVRSGP